MVLAQTILQVRKYLKLKYGGIQRNGILFLLENKKNIFFLTVSSLIKLTFNSTYNCNDNKSLV